MLNRSITLLALALVVAAAPALSAQTSVAHSAACPAPPI